MEKPEQENSRKKTLKNPILVASSQMTRILVVLAFALLFALLFGLFFGIPGGPVIGVIVGLIAGVVASFIFYGLVAGP
jgi:divalent metal cation (Fe/Co/Zn/Cd) transporter